MSSRNILYYLAIGFLIIGIFLNESEARRKILRGRKNITRRYYNGTAIPAWSIAMISGLSMLIIGGGLYLILKKLMIDSIEINEASSYQPAMQDDV
ncbi:PREDICTED: uncharacterized protein LOC105366694 [Ceratosolen solmsi marchali]|uniref:Uncharacterized protein LOC105366694 n=1 Tax=Ceratosolen solmsi marchali TaxID=326594 RepID=A0AAJ7E0U7_9HYME|nr:PREDICTED: uncharacterized protein LOC105366694 [Ceratosolen solmsi marchali]